VVSDISLASQSVAYFFSAFPATTLTLNHGPFAGIYLVPKFYLRDRVAPNIILS